MKKNKVVDIGNVSFSNDLDIKIILGPCQIESRNHAMETCSEINEICGKLNIKYVYKSSYDKANRSSHTSARGIGIDKGIDILNEIKSKYNCPVLTDVHEVDQCKKISKYIDIIQIPAFLCRQTDLIISAAKTGKVINLKKGQFMSPESMEHAVKKIKESGNEKVEKI